MYIFVTDKSAEVLRVVVGDEKCILLLEVIFYFCAYIFLNTNNGQKMSKDKPTLLQQKQAHEKLNHDLKK